MSDDALPATPEHAAAAADERARAAEQTGRYTDAEAIEAMGSDDRGGIDRLHEWAMIEVGVDGVRSTRPLGAPITQLKRRLVRMLAQYFNEQEAQISRFNVHLLGYVTALEDRVGELERRLARAERAQDDASGDGPAGPAGPAL